MKLLAEVPGGKRARVMMFVLIAFCAVSIRSVDRVVTQWFVAQHFPDPPAPPPEPPGGTHWDPGSM
jgi:hypothetical protein